MVVPLGPGKFYGSSLPRPRIYNEVKLNPDRVDPPVPVNDAFLSWAEEAHWSMGGLSFQRLRLQGRIEGNLDRLRKFKEKQAKSQAKGSLKHPKAPTPNVGNAKEGKTRKRVRSVSPPPAPKMTKRGRRFMDLFDSDSEEEDQVEEEEEVSGKKLNKKRPARRLVGEFDRVANEIEANKIKSEKVGEVGVRTRRRAMDDEVMKVVEELNREVSKGKTKLKKGGSKNGGERSGSWGASGVRVSPRLAKLR